LDGGEDLVQGDEGALGDRRFIGTGMPADGISATADGASWELHREIHFFDTSYYIANLYRTIIPYQTRLVKPPLELYTGAKRG